MDFSDTGLGMGRAITRRDFINGIGIAFGAACLDPAIARAAGGTDLALDYPPRQTGLRGAHAGSFEVAHALRDRHLWDLGSARSTGETYDLVIVGGGISGLSAAHFYLQAVGRSASVLILDNHDDFGGHAKRNEFEHGGKLIAINAGTLNIESPNRYNAPAKRLLRDIGVDLDRYVDANAGNRALYDSLGLRDAFFFDRETWGNDRLIIGSADEVRGFDVDFLARAPLTDRARGDLRRLYDPLQPDYLPGLSSAEKKLRLAKMSYEHYLLKVAVVDPSLLWFFRTAPAGWYCAGPDATPALFAWNDGLPGFAGLSLEPTPDGVLADLPGGQHGRQRMEGGGGEIHFPDGNATVARLLVRSLIPDAVPGRTQEDSGAAHVDYARLDRIGQPARIRLNSTVVNVEHGADSGQSRDVRIAYVRAGATHTVRARQCILACWNMVIPHLMPTLPAVQKEALAYQVKRPLVYTNVVIRNWRSFHRLGISSVSTPGMYHNLLSLTEAASLGDLRHASGPDEPIAVRMERMPCSPGLPIKDQHRAGRAELLATPFETFEREIRSQMTRILGPGGFDAARDILAITVNRWPHGYAYSYNSLWDPLDWVFGEGDDRPNVVARQPFGLVSIANSDAAASSHTDAAILEAHRAVTEVLNRRSMPLRG